MKVKRRRNGVEKNLKKGRNSYKEERYDCYNFFV
jgi:hypothetical protein